MGVYDNGNKRNINYQLDEMFTSSIDKVPFRFFWLIA